MTVSTDTARETSNSPVWHSLELDEVFERLETSKDGLTSEEAATRLEKFGPNKLPSKRPPAWWEIALRQFRSPLIYILAIAAVISLMIDEATDAAFIVAVILLNGIIGGYQEWKAEQSSHALRKLLQIRASIVRDGEIVEMDAEKAVPGDVVVLESGNRVPADLRLVRAQGLQIDESFLTGESVAVAKDAAWEGEEATVMADRLNFSYAGSVVTRGRGRGIVVATGAGTAVGQLAKDVQEGVGGKPPLLERMERFTHVIAVTTVVAASAIAFLGVALGRYEPADMFLFAVALAVSAIPEGLPVAMTVALSVATSRMAKRGVIVRKLTAVEGLGSCTLIATDKTGTLTVNEMTVREVFLPGGKTFEATGEGFQPNGEVQDAGKTVKAGANEELDALVLAGVLSNESDLHRRNGEWVSRGDAVDIALLVLGEKVGIKREVELDRLPQINEIPFESERQFAATYHKVGGKPKVFVKGAPERVLSMCKGDPDDNHELRTAAESMARRGYRVLALADAWVEENLDSSEAPTQPSDLEFLGFVGMIDPLRSGVKEAVEACHGAGINVSMVTGDHAATAFSIARELAMAQDESQVVTGAELAEKKEDELSAAVKGVRVFARVAPHQKLQIVKAAKEGGDYVAVTGDGVNDAPALRAANIGVAMGKSGTDVAREAAELVISDDNFATIVAGVEEGRIAYDNIRKVVYLLISTGAAELALVLSTVIAGLPLPLLPVQILWLNLVTNGIQGVALAFEPGEGDTLRRKPRSPQESIFNPLMIYRTLIAVTVMGAVGFGVFFYWMDKGWAESSARNALLLLMVLFENVHIGNCRSETKSAFALSPLRSPFLLAGTLAAFLIHMAATFHPWGHAVLGTEPVSLEEGLTLFALALTILPAVELHKWFWNRKERRAAQ